MGQLISGHKGTTGVAAQEDGQVDGEVGLDHVGFLHGLQGKQMPLGTLLAAVLHSFVPVLAGADVLEVVHMAGGGVHEHVLHHRVVPQHPTEGTLSQITVGGLELDVGESVLEHP